MKHPLLAITVVVLVSPAFARDGDPRMHDPSSAQRLADVLEGHARLVQALRRLRAAGVSFEDRQDLLASRVVDH